MKVFNYAFEATMYHEGGFSDHPLDTGGATKFGISLRFLRSIGADLDGDGDIDIDDVLLVTEDSARQFYYDYFWIEAKCNKIKSELLAAKIFDMAVNVGPKRAWKIVQSAINNFEPQKVKIDGIPGPNTLEAINSMSSVDWNLLEEIRTEQKYFYKNLIEKNPSFSAFRLGWLRRAAY